MSKLSRSDYDPLFLHARREAAVVLCAWFGFFLWVIGYAAWKGYDPSNATAPVAMILGIPSWVFWGVGLPWLIANLFTFWFAFRGMADDPLTEVAGESTAKRNRADDATSR